jgi:hypothetical protein
MNWKATKGRLQKAIVRLSAGAVVLSLCAVESQAQTRVTYAQQPDGTWNYLQLVNDVPLTYDEAVTAAINAGGHLFTPRSRSENAAAAGLSAEAWIGLDDTDAGTGEGNWSLVDDGAGRQTIWNGLGSGAGGTPVVGAYHNWNGSGEPNDAGGEDAAVILANGYWNDLPNATASVTRNYIVEYDTGAAVQPDPAPGLPQATAGQWNIRRINGMPDIQNVRGIEMALYSGLGTTADYQAPTINFKDQNSGDGLMPFGTVFPGDDPGNADENNFAIYARGRIKIEEENDYTFGFYGDDGSELRIHGQNFSSSTNIGDGANIYLLESNLPAVAHDGDTIAFPNPTGSGSVLGVVHLTPGEYDLTYKFFENGGGAHAELFAATGAHTTFDSNVFRPVGHQARPPVEVATPGVTGGWAVATTAPGGVNLTTLAEAVAEYTSEQPAFATYDSINFNDPGFGGPGRIAGDVPFPVDTAADDEDFALLAYSSLEIPVDGVYRFGFQGDDGGEFGFVDTSIQFTSLVENATGLSAITEGVFGGGGMNAITCDCLTGNSSTVGEVFLTAGTYDIYTGFWERGGGAYFEVFGSGPNAASYSLLMTGGASVETIVDFNGLQLVPEPTGVLTICMGLLGLFASRRRRS